MAAVQSIFGVKRRQAALIGGLVLLGFGVLALLSGPIIKNGFADLAIICVFLSVGAVLSASFTERLRTMAMAAAATADVLLLFFILLSLNIFQNAGDGWLFIALPIAFTTLPAMLILCALSAYASLILGPREAAAQAGSTPIKPTGRGRRLLLSMFSSAIFSALCWTIINCPPAVPPATFESELAKVYGTYLAKEGHANRGAAFEQLTLFLELSKNGRLGGGVPTEKELVEILGPPDFVRGSGTTKESVYFYNNIGKKDSLVFVSIKNGKLEKMGWGAASVNDVSDWEKYQPEKQLNKGLAPPNAPVKK